MRAITSRVDAATGAEIRIARVDHDNASIASATAWAPSGAYAFTALEGNRAVSVMETFSHFEIGRVGAGRAPQGLVVSPDGQRLYVDDFMDRTVSVFSLADLLAYDDPMLPKIAVVAKGAPEQLAPAVLLGKQLFYDAADPRLALESYMACASCHNDGDQDGRVWDFAQFGEGMRNTISLRGHGQGHGRLHWSANFDEVQDFEGQIRGFARGIGLMSNADFAATAAPLGAPKAGLDADLDALAAYVGSLGGGGPEPAPGGRRLAHGRCAGRPRGLRIERLRGVPRRRRVQRQRNRRACTTSARSGRAAARRPPSIRRRCAACGRPGPTCTTARGRSRARCSRTRACRCRLRSSRSSSPT